MNADDKRLLKSVVKRVHPDLFNDLPLERDHNSGSLQTLNSYLADIGKRGSSKAVVLSFWVKDKQSKELIKLKTELPAWGSIGPLLYAFELITEDQLVAGKGNCSGKNARSVLSWLESSVGKAADAAEEHESVRAEVRNLKSSLETNFSLGSVKLSKEYSTSVTEQRRHVEALKLLLVCLGGLDRLHLAQFQGLHVQLHHPPQGDGNYSPEESMDFGSDEDWIGDDGTLHVLADPISLPSALKEIDVHQARLLQQVAGFWQRRSRDLVRALRAVLGIQKILCDSYTERADQSFVEWAARLLDKRAALPADQPVHKHDFSLLLHTDQTAPYIEFTPASSMLQVRCDTAPEDLLNYLNTTARSEAVTDVEERNREEEQVLERLRRELGLKHAIRVCAASEQEKVVNAAKRLLQHQEHFKAAGINLQGASLAFDNCYEVWESGFISIPHDFTLDDLKPKLQLLLAAPHSQNGAPRVEPLTGLDELSGAGMLSRAGMQRSANAVLDKRHAKAHADRLANGNEAHDKLSPEPHMNGDAQRQSSEGEKGSGEGGKPNNAKKWRRRRGKSKARMRLPRASPKLATDHHIASFISQEFTKVRWQDHSNDAPLILCASSQPAAQVRVLPPAIPFLRVCRYKQLFWPKVRGSLYLPLS